MFRRHPRKFAHYRPAVFAQLQRVVATVFTAPPAGDNAFCFEIIDKGDHPAGHNSEVLRQCLLADPGVRRNLTDQARVWRGQSQSGNSVGKASRGLGSYLSQEKSNSHRPPN